MNIQDILYEAGNQVKKVKDGEMNPLALYGDLNELRKGLDELRKELYDDVILEVQKYSRGEDAIYENYLYSVASRTNYKLNQDAEYELINQKLKNRKALIKKATERDEDLTDPETGETVSPVEKSVSVFPKVKYMEVLHGSN